MDDLESRLNTVLSNPQLMQQIMAMAKSMSDTQPQPQRPEPQTAPQPEIDPSLLTRIAALSRQGGIDREQQALLNALSPYLNHERVHRLERAMKAARTARLASGLLGENGIPFLKGR